MRRRVSQLSLRSVLRPGSRNDGILDRIRVASFAMLGLTAATALGLVAFIANQGFPEVGSLMPNPTVHRQAIGESSIVSAPALEHGPYSALAAAAGESAGVARADGGNRRPQRDRGGSASAPGQGVVVSAPQPSSSPSAPVVSPPASTSPPSSQPAEAPASSPTQVQVSSPPPSVGPGNAPTSPQTPTSPTTPTTPSPSKPTSSTPTSTPEAPDDDSQGESPSSGQLPSSATPPPSSTPAPAPAPPSSQTPSSQTPPAPTPPSSSGGSSRGHGWGQYR